MEIKISGASDDLIEYSVDGVDEEINAEHADLQVISQDGGQLQVGVDYVNPGVWAAAIRQVDDGVPVPETWDIRVRQQPDTPYSVEVVIQTSAPARVQDVTGRS